MANVGGKGKGKGGVAHKTKRWRKAQEFLKHHNRMRYLTGARAKGQRDESSE